MEQPVNHDSDTGELTAGTTPGCSDDESEMKETDIINIIVAFSIRHSLSKVAVGDMLDMLRVLGVTKNLPSSKHMLLKSYLEEIDDKKCIHFYCSKCMSYMTGREANCSVCEQHFSQTNAMKDGHFFVYLPIHDQLKDLLESGYIEEHRVTFGHEAGVLRDIVDGDMYRRVGEAPSRSLNKLTLSWNFDGLPIFKSSGASIWPILIQINELNPSARKEQMLMCALWFGPRKPLWSAYSKPFLEELSKLGTTGIAWKPVSDVEQTRITKVRSHAIVCDAPARCMVQGTHQFNGAYGCTWCLQEGSVVAKGNGVCRVYDYEHDVPKRTQANVIDSVKTLLEQNLTHHNGVKTASPLLRLPDCCGVDIVRSFSVDYMHAVLLGVVRMFLELWFSSKWSSAPFSIRGSMGRVDSRLLAIKPPQDISRTPRSLLDGKQWKASECRNWLLFYSVPAMLGIMPTKYMDHWCLLVDAMHTLLQDRVQVADISRAERGLHSFVKGVETLYDQEHMSFNVHSLLHLGDCVRDFGPLWASSAFPYEGFMMKIKQLFSGTTHLPQQVASNFLMMQTLRRNIAAPDSDKRVSEMAAKWLGVYSLSCKAMGSREGAVGLGSGRVASLQPRERRLLLLNGYAVAEETHVTYFKRAIIEGSVYCTEAYGTGHKRNSFTIFTRYGVGRVQSICFIDGTDGVQCVIFLRRSDFVDAGLPLARMQSVISTETLMMCRPAEVECNAVVVDVERNGRLVSICVKQPNRVEKD